MTVCEVKCCVVVSCRPCSTACLPAYRSVCGRYCLAFNTRGRQAPFVSRRVTKHSLLPWEWFTLHCKQSSSQFLQYPFRREESEQVTEKRTAQLGVVVFVFVVVAFPSWIFWGSPGIRSSTLTNAFHSILKLIQVNHDHVGVVQVMHYKQFQKHTLRMQCPSERQHSKVYMRY